MPIASTIAWFYQKIFQPQSFKFHAASGKRAARQYRRKVAPPEGRQSIQKTLEAYRSAMGTIQDGQKPTPKIARTQAKYQATSWLVYQIEKEQGRTASTEITSQDSGDEPSLIVVENLELLSSAAKLGRVASSTWESTTRGLMDEGARFVSLLVWTTACVELQKKIDAKRQDNIEPLPSHWRSLLVNHELLECKKLDSFLSTANDHPIHSAFLHPSVLRRTNVLATALATGDLKGVIDATEIRDGLRKVVEEALAGC